MFRTYLTRECSDIRKGLVALTLCMAGCVPSVYSLYRQQDLIVDDSLGGTWRQDSGADQGIEMTLTRSNRGKAYLLAYTNNNEHIGEFLAHLVELDGVRYFDLFPVTPANFSEADLDDVALLYRRMRISVHSFFRVEIEGETMQVSFLNLGWLTEYLAANPEAVDHVRLEGNGGILLTADTLDLQAFLRTVQKQYADQAFTKPIVFHKSP